MNSEIRNSFSLVGNISSINEVKEQANGTKYRYFDIAQNNKYKNKDGEIVNEPSFYSIKIYEKQFEQFDKLLEIGKYINVSGKLNMFKDKDKKTNMILIGTDCRVLDKNKNKDELFEYDWLNEDDDEYKQKQSDDLEM